MKIVTFSGVDGSGKSTQSRLLVEKLRARGERIATIHANRKLLRKDVKGNDGAQHQKKKWPTGVIIGVGLKDLLKLWMLLLKCYRSDVIVADRYIDDTIVKLRYYGAKLPLFERALKGCVPRPFHQFWIEVDPQKSFERDREYPLSYHQEKAAHYHDWFARYVVEGKVVRLDGNESAATLADQVSQRMHVRP